MCGSAVGSSGCPNTHLLECHTLVCCDAVAALAAVVFVLQKRITYPTRRSRVVRDVRCVKLFYMIFEKKKEESLQRRRSRFPPLSLRRSGYVVSLTQYAEEDRWCVDLR